MYSFFHPLYDFIHSINVSMGVKTPCLLWFCFGVVIKFQFLYLKPQVSLCSVQKNKTTNIHIEEHRWTYLPVSLPSAANRFFFSKRLILLLRTVNPPPRRGKQRLKVIVRAMRVVICYSVPLRCAGTQPQIYWAHLQANIGSFLEAELRPKLLSSPASETVSELSAQKCSRVRTRFIVFFFSQRGG